MRRLPASIPLALLCAGLLSCTPLGWRSAADTGASASAVDAYRAGRAHHLAQRPEPARAAYLAALQADPAHLDARNGLATLHAEYGELPEAIAIWRALTAPLGRDAGPARAYLFGNLGRALYLNGDVDAARVALEKACLLDPLAAGSWQLLGQVLATLGQEERAQQMLAQAAALRRHDLRADFAVAGTGNGSRVAAIGQALAAPQQLKQKQENEQEQSLGFDHTWIHAGADGMMELRRALPTAALTPSTTPATPATATLEIRNGNGVTGMARALSRRLGEPGVQVTRLSNEPGFAVRQTRIEYTAPHADAARLLALRLGSVQLHEVGHRLHADLRLVLGRDLARHGAALRLMPAPTSAPAQLLSYR